MTFSSHWGDQEGHALGGRGRSNPWTRKRNVAAALTLSALLGAGGVAGADAAVAAPTAPAAWEGGHAHREVKVSGVTFHLNLAAGPVRLPSDGGSVPVIGAGYNTAQGIFLAFCVIPRTVRVGDPATYTTLPTPCLGGRESTDGSARRITNDATGTPGVTIPYGPHGSFLTSLNLKPQISDGVVCDVTVQCAIVTRADFTATGDRTYDQYIPVHFTS